MSVEIVELTPEIIGARLGQNLYNSKGCLLLRKGVEINEHYFSYFKENGYKSVFLLSDPFDSNGAPVQPVSEKLMATAPPTLKKIFRLLMHESKTSTMKAKNELVRLAEAILADVDYKVHKIGNVLDLKRRNDYLFQHSVNVAIYAVLMGHSLNLTQSALRHLVIAALLHDFGMLFIEPSILNKESMLEQEEFERIKEHTTQGFRHLVGHCFFDGLSSVASVQHHERFDGEGYPKNLTGEQIHEFSRIITLADFFDAWTSDRPHRRLHSIDTTLDFIQSNVERIFDPRLVEVFVRLFG
ncbi:MAG: HD domain-containing protein [Calditrichaeota bacterium]|nr:MAG: HD domain-containing protein [Calditrichota bacterium]